MSIFICFGFSCWLNQVSSSFQALDENVKMKLSQFCHVPDQKAHEAIFQVLNLQRYGNKSYIDERHPHRYEVNPELVRCLEKGGLCFTGKDITGRRMEIVELRNHPYYVGVQFHPEFESKLGKPSALFSGLIAASYPRRRDREFPRHSIVSSRMRSNASSLNPDISHREGFSAAAKNWAHFPHIHFGLMPDQTGKKTNVCQQE
ncbi:hypothetical protein CsatA_003078 [Cannabis sativa]